MRNLELLQEILGVQEEAVLAKTLLKQDGFPALPYLISAPP